MSQYDVNVDDLECFDRSVKENNLRGIVYDLERQLLEATNVEEKQYLEIHLDMFKNELSLYDKENNLLDLRSQLMAQLNYPLTSQASQHILSQIQSIDRDLSALQLEMQLSNMTM